MSEMIERVAKALSEREGSGPWEGGLLGESGREMWRKTARAAIEAMREPTPDMIQSAIPELLYDDQQDCIGAAYTAMIDEALSERGPLRPAGSADAYGVPRAEE